MPPESPGNESTCLIAAQAALPRLQPPASPTCCKPTPIGVLCSLLSMLGALLEKCPHGLTPEEAAILHHILVRYQVPTAALLQPSHQALQLFQKAMGVCGKPCDGQESPQTMALRQADLFSTKDRPVCGWCSAPRTGLFVDGVQHQDRPVSGWCSAPTTGLLVDGVQHQGQHQGQACLWMVFTTKDRPVCSWCSAPRTGLFVDGVQHQGQACLWMVFSTKDRPVCGWCSTPRTGMCVDGVQHQGQACLWMVFSTKDRPVCGWCSPPRTGLFVVGFQHQGQITKEFFSSLPSPAVRLALLSTLFDLQVIAPNPQIAKEISHVLKVISLQAEEVAIELKKFTQSAPSTSVRGAKKMRRATLQAKVTQRSATDSEPWRRVTVILEMLQNKKKVRNLQLIVPPLFAILARIDITGDYHLFKDVNPETRLCLEEEEQTPVEYLKQLVLTCLLNTCERLSPDNNPLPPDVLPEEQFNAELVVQCIQLSDSPQTHNQALLLLGTAAGLFPDKVLHQAMAIFTFMGAHVLRQDDTYSLQIITRTVDTVIPALIQASERNPSLTVANQKLDSIVAMVIRVFVDALPHIPEHRRQAVFHHLVRTVGGGQYLWTTLALVFESKVVGKTGGGVHSDGEDKVLGSDAEFCVELCSHFPPDVQVLSLVQLLKYISSLPEDKEDRKGVWDINRDLPQRKGQGGMNQPRRKKRSEPLFDVANHTAHQLRNFKFLAVSFFPVLLGNSLFVGQLVDLEMEASDKMRGLYQSLLEETLQYIRQVALSLDKNSTNPTARFWRALLHKAYDTLEKVNALLPTEVFIGVVSGLMQNNMATVRKKAMELLNSKLQQPGQQWAQGR
ncbi:HEAT repeat-containing protein 1 [Branchiostoma belcheri]|nr:HEAT repeat-containing protein 1 [Branchiostoma belcheri]